MQNLMFFIQKMSRSAAENFSILRIVVFQAPWPLVRNSTP